MRGQHGLILLLGRDGGDDDCRAIEIPCVVLNDQGWPDAHLFRAETHPKVSIIDFATFVYLAHGMLLLMGKLTQCAYVNAGPQGEKGRKIILKIQTHPLARLICSDKPICPRHPGLSLGNHQAAGGLPAPRVFVPRQDLCRLPSLPATV